ncbi:17157_t:CDS:2 [Rhizophagus irregularis]|nr:17157_t:CDS:2 [Rhizophagus irregularis]
MSTLQQNPPFLIEEIKNWKQTSSVQEVRLNALEDKLTSVQELLQKSVIQQQVEQFNPTQGKGKKRVVEQEQGYENPTKVLKISSTTNVKSTLKSSEMDVDDTNNKVNANILSSNEDIFKGYVDSGILDPRVGVTETMKDSGQLMGYVIMSVGTRRMLVRSYGPIKTDICYFSVPK